jgi:hypothetical protein
VEKGPDTFCRPKWIDLIFKKGNRAYAVHGIYEVRDDEFLLCIPMAQPKVRFENKRPENFDTKGKLIALLRAKRVVRKE